MQAQNTMVRQDEASDRIGNIYRQILADKKAKAAAAGTQSQTSSSAASKVSTASNQNPEQKKRMTNKAKNDINTSDYQSIDEDAGISD
jgi:hypothetical protein